jgi:glycine oxidase
VVGTRAPEIAVIGGGIIGCALAYDLATQGIKTLLIDRQQFGREASGASAGIISPPGSTHGERAELALLGFRRHNELLPEIEERTGIVAGSSPRGVIRLGLAADEAELRASHEWQRQSGITAEWLGPDDLKRREPALHDRFQYGIANPGASSVLLGQFALGLARAAELAGAQVCPHLPVTGITVDQDRVTAIETARGTIPVGGAIVAAGAWSEMFAASLRYPIPVKPVRGQMMAVNDLPRPLHSVVVHKGNYLVPRADGTTAVGATEEHDAGFDGRVSPAGIAWLAGVADSLAPTLSDGRLVSHWYGLRPGITLSSPLIGRVPGIENAWLATGHFRAGAVLATATSKLLTQTIIEGMQHPLLAACDPARLAAVTA